ncbi:MAG: DUF6064 family protein [Candidatus Kapaibacterium sp.]
MPFSIEEFFQLFGTYNLAIWPIHIIMFIFGVSVVVVALVKETRTTSRIIAAVLAFFWLWMGIFYHFNFFADINPAAMFFGIACIIEGGLLLFAGFLGLIRFHATKDMYGIIGWIFVLYGLVFYHLVGMLAGHCWPEMSVFGVAPCPTTIFTFGIFLWAKGHMPVWLIIIPLLWSLIGTSTAISLGVPQDYGLLIAGVAGFVLVLVKNKTLKRGKAAT